MWIRISFARALFLAWASSGCASTGPPTPPNGSGDPTPQPAVPASGRVQELRSSGGEYVIEYVSRPDPIPLNEPFELQVRVLDAAGSVAQGVELFADARMPAHRHGMNTAARVERLPDGGFLVRGLLLHMSGHWELYLDVSRDGATDRAQFDLRF